MAHDIYVIFGHRAVVAKIAAAAGNPPLTELPQGFVIAPLGEREIDRLTGLAPGEHRDGFNYLSAGLERALSQASHGEAFAYLETNYFGGRGNQAAALFRAGGPPELFTEAFNSRINANSPINTAVRALGVKAEPGLDEFDTLGLRQFRSLDALGLFHEDDED